MANERNDQAHDQEFVDAIKKPARYNFGNGLFLDVKKSGKYWVFAYNGTAVGEGPRERIGLGTAKNMRLKDAQREALLLDQVLENDSSPKVHWAQRKSTGLGGPVTFAQAAEQYYEVARDEVWKADGSWMLMRGIKNNYLLKADCAKLPLQAVNHLHIEAILKRNNFDPRKAGVHLISQVHSALAVMLGEDATKKLFANYGPKPKSYESKQRQCEFMVMYEVAGRPSVTKFARYAADWNKGRPLTDRIGCGTDDWVNTREYLKRQLRKKKYQAGFFNDRFYVVPFGWDPPRNKVEHHF